MMRFSTRLALALLAAAAAPAFATPAPPADRLAAEVARWQERIKTTTPADDETRDIRQGSLLYLGHAEQALGRGWRWLAFARLALVWGNLEATDYRGSLPADLRQQMAELEKEWRRLGPELEAPPAPAWQDTPAAARAIAEAAFGEVPVYYEASLDYGKNTAPEYGLFYLGSARAQLALARLAAADRAAAGRKAPPLRSVAAEIAALDDLLLAAYQPPASMDQHPTFIRISSQLNQAATFDRQGLRHAALYRLLDARMRLSRLLSPERKLSVEDTERRSREALAARAGLGVDDSLLELFLEVARFSAADPDPAALGPQTAAAILEDVVPLYHAALGPAPLPTETPKPVARVTLLRWPYT